MSSSSYISFTDQQKSRASNTDLVDFLRRQGETVLRKGHEYCWEAHPSVRIDGNRWYRHSREIGGEAIDFAKYFYNLRYPKAIQLLLGESGEEYALAEKRRERELKPLEIPRKNNTNHRVFAYLSKERNIAPCVINFFLSKGNLYEDAEYHNAVFVGTDKQGDIKHVHKRSTNSTGETFRQTLTGSDKQYGFSHIGTSGRIYVFEAPIDLLSYLSLFPMNWQDHSYLSLTGVSKASLLHTLDTYDHLSQVVFCLDNDEAGQKTIKRIASVLRELGYTDLKKHIPHEKDWNQELGVLALSAPESMMQSQNIG